MALKTLPRFRCATLLPCFPSSPPTLIGLARLLDTASREGRVQLVGRLLAHVPLPRSLHARVRARAHGVPAGDRVDTLAGCGGGGRDLGRLRVFVARHRGCAPRRTILSYALEGLQVAEMNLVPVGACFGVLATLSWEAIDACTHMHADAAVP